MAHWRAGTVGTEQESVTLPTDQQPAAAADAGDPMGRCATTGGAAGAWVSPRVLPSSVYEAAGLSSDTRCMDSKASIHGMPDLGVQLLTIQSVS